MDQCFYSAPFVLIGEWLWVRATAMMVQVFDGHELLASHVRALRPGTTVTVPEHLPPEAQAFLRQTPAWCRERAGEIGPACQAVIDQLLADRFVERLRAAQSVIRLCESYGRERLESACRRAVSFGDPRYRTVKTISPCSSKTKSPGAIKGTSTCVYAEPASAHRKRSRRSASTSIPKSPES